MSLSVPALNPDTKQRVEAVLTRAAEDIEFRELLLLNPAEALQETNLTDEEKDALGSMQRVALEEWGIDVRRYRSFLMDNGNKVVNRGS